MNRNQALGVVVVAVVLVTGLGVALFLGVGPAPGGGSGDSIEDFPTATGDDDGSEDDGASASSDEAPFSFTVDEVEECGQTCRDVTATLHNNQDRTASGITVYTRVIAGEDNTDPDDVVWEGSDQVGSLDAGASYTATERVELSFRDGLKVERADGWITILTTIESDDTTVTFQDSERVA